MCTAKQFLLKLGEALVWTGWGSVRGEAGRSVAPAGAHKAGARPGSGSRSKRWSAAGEIRSTAAPKNCHRYPIIVYAYARFGCLGWLRYREAFHHLLAPYDLGISRKFLIKESACDIHKSSYRDRKSTFSDERMSYSPYSPNASYQDLALTAPLTWATSLGWTSAVTCCNVYREYYVPVTSNCRKLPSFFYFTSSSYVKLCSSYHSNCLSYEM